MGKPKSLTPNPFAGSLYMEPAVNPSASAPTARPHAPRAMATRGDVTGLRSPRARPVAAPEPPQRFCLPSGQVLTSESGEWQSWAPKPSGSHSLSKEPSKGQLRLFPSC